MKKPQIQAGESEPRRGSQRFDVDWILSFFVSLDDQIARISRMKAPPLSWAIPRSLLLNLLRSNNS